MARRKSRRKKATKEKEPRLRVFVVAGLTILFAIIGYFLNDYYGVRFRFTGAYVWSVALLISFFVTLFYLAQYTLPLEWYESWMEGLHLTTRYNFPIFARIIRMIFRRPKMPAAIPDLESELAAGFMIHRAGIVPSHQVYALTRGQSFVRVVGPGYVRLEGAVVISQIIDLRRHLRSVPVKALTRDGIPLETAVTVIFQVNQPADLDETNRLPYPYDRNVLFHVNYLNNFSDGDGTLSWSDRIIRQASSALISELSNYTLDNLYQPEVPGTLPLEEIKQELKRRLETTFEKYGVSIYAVGVSQFKLPAEVQEQRVKFWQASWRQRIQTEMAAGEAEAMRRIKLARARAQIEIIESITDSIEAMGRSGETDLTEIVALRMLEAMDKALADDTVKALVPQYVVSTLNQVNSWLQEGD